MEQANLELIGTHPMVLRPADGAMAQPDFQDTLPPLPEDLVAQEAWRLLLAQGIEVDGLEVLPPSAAHEGCDGQEGYSLVVQARHWTPAIAAVSDQIEPDLRRALLPTGIKLTVVFWRVMDAGE